MIPIESHPRVPFVSPLFVPCSEISDNVRKASEWISPFTIMVPVDLPQNPQVPIGRQKKSLFQLEREAYSLFPRSMIFPPSDRISVPVTMVWT